MKNWLNYYYDLYEVDIHQIKSGFLFQKDGYNYIFFHYSKDIDNLKNIYDFSEELQSYGIYCHKIILNKDKQIFTNVNGKKYILMRCYQNLEKKIIFDNIIEFSNIYVPNGKLRCDDWKTLWKMKIDYFEYQLSQFGNKHKLLRNSFNYFSGYVETAIMMLDNMYIENKKLTLSHRRINFEDNLYDLYNPFNLIIDHRVRDVAEFFKSQFLQKKNIDNLFYEMVNFLNNVYFEEYEYKMFFIRMMYPTFYFDVFEIIVNDNTSDDLLIPVIKKSDDYMKMIILLYRYISKYIKLPLIEWLQ